jgi:oxygen-independent coproporphyrinogen-3 oxidase
LPAEDILADIQLQGEKLLAQEGWQQYEVSAYSRPGFACQHNLNYWQFGDYLGIGAGAHGKITTRDGRILRYDKRRQPDEYLAVGANDYLVNSRALEEGEITGEFMLNALRLNSGFSLTDFTARTGLPKSNLQPQLDQLQDKSLLQLNDGQVCATELGRRHLDTVVAEFFPG